MGDEVSYDTGEGNGRMHPSMNCNVHTRDIQVVEQGKSMPQPATPAPNRRRGMGLALMSFFFLSFSRVDDDGHLLPVVVSLFQCLEEIVEAVRVNPLGCSIAEANLQMDLEFLSTLRCCPEPVFR